MLLVTLTLVLSPLVQSDPPPDPQAALALFESAYREVSPFRVTMRLAEEVLAPVDDLVILGLIEESEAPIVDPQTGKDLWWMSSREVINDFPANRSMVRMWHRQLRLPDPRLDPRGSVQIVSDGTMVQADIVQKNPGRLVTGKQESTAEYLRARRRGESTPSAMAAQADYLSLILFALRSLPHVKDLQISSHSADAYTLESDSLAIACQINAHTGECTAIRMTTVSGVTSQYEPLDYFDAPAFPARAPSLVRVENDFLGRANISLHLYDNPPEPLLPTDDLFDWRTYRTSAFDVKRKILIHADGTEGPGRDPIIVLSRAEEKQFLRAFMDHPNDQTEGNSKDPSSTSIARPPSPPKVLPPAHLSPHRRPRTHPRRHRPRHPKTHGLTHSPQQRTPNNTRTISPTPPPPDSPHTAAHT